MRLCMWIFNAALLRFRKYVSRVLVLDGLVCCRQHRPDTVETEVAEGVKALLPASRFPAVTAPSQRRRDDEAEMIAAARAEAAAGKVVYAGEVDAWIASLGTDHELPPPCSVR